MRGAGAAEGPSATATRAARAAAEVESLRQAIRDLESQLLQLKKRIDAYESETPAPLMALDGAEAAPAPDEADLARSVSDALGYGLNLAGVVALVLAIGFIARISFRSGSAGSLLAVAGGCAGLLLLARFFRRRGSARLALWLEGGAVGVGYLSAYAVFSLAGSLPAALLLATLIAAAGVGVSLARASQAIGVFAVFGAVLTPLLMRGGAQAGGQSALLFTYLALLNVCTLVVSRVRDWPWQAASSLLATHFLAWLWFADVARPSHADPALTFLFPCVTFLVFLVRPLMRIRPAPGWHEKALVVANTLLFLAALHTLLFAYARHLLAFAPAAVGLVHGVAAALFGARCGLAATHLTLMTLLLLPGVWQAWRAGAALVWVGQGLLLGLLGLRYNRWIARMSGYVILSAAMGLTPRAYVALPAAVAGTFYLRRARRLIPQVEDFEWLARWVLTCAMLLGGLIAISMELHWILAGTALAAATQFFYSLCMAAYAAALSLWGRARHSSFLRACALAFFAALALKVFFFDLAALAGGWRVGSLVLLAACLLAVSTGQRDRPAS